MLKANCSKCGKRWDVSIHKNLKVPFICPHCQFRRDAKKIVLILAGFLVCCLMVPKFGEMAYQQRGYEAIGGEILIPFLYLAVVGLIDTVWGWNSGEF